MVSGSSVVSREVLPTPVGPVSKILAPRFSASRWSALIIFMVPAPVIASVPPLSQFRWREFDWMMMMMMMDEMMMMSKRRRLARTIKSDKPRCENGHAHYCAVHEVCVEGARCGWGLLCEMRENRDLI